MSEKDVGEATMPVLGAGGKGTGWEGSDKSVSESVREDDEGEGEGGLG